MNENIINLLSFVGAVVFTFFLMRWILGGDVFEPFFSKKYHYFVSYTFAKSGTGRVFVVSLLKDFLR